MTREELIEKVASSIYKVRNGAGCQHWGRLPNSHKLPYIQDANAAINTIFAALKEPTEEMELAPDPDDCPTPDACYYTWRAMLAASPLAPEENK